MDALYELSPRFPWSVQEEDEEDAVEDTSSHLASDRWQWLPVAERFIVPERLERILETSRFSLEDPTSLALPIGIFLSLFVSLLALCSIRSRPPRRRARTLSDSRAPLRARTLSDTLLLRPQPTRPRLWTGGTHLEAAAAPRKNTSDMLFRELQQEDSIRQVILLDQHDHTNVPYYGPTVTCLQYETWTPPPSWKEASRRLYPQDPRKMPLQRQLELSIYKEDGSTQRLTIRDFVSEQRRKDKMHSTTPNEQDFLVQFPVDSVSVHTQPPADGGVLEVYVKDSPRPEWLEYTFTSARDAAQFQVDLLALQMLGDSIRHLYSVLQLIHCGSPATTTKEFVLHDELWQPEDTTLAVGVAWDDVMRCLGSAFPAIRLRLEQLWWRQETQQSLEADKKNDGTTDNGEPGENTYSILPEYVKKRKLLGPVDFFRLFVPVLPETAVPGIKSSKERMEQMLRWRKRVARASLLVQAYARARTVVDKGWKLDLPLPEGYIQQRMAFDDNTENTLFDANVSNEVYEATVSRDVICQVRGPGCLTTNTTFGYIGLSASTEATFSEYQGYSLIGMHVFQVPPSGEDYPLQPDKDPVLALPSLRHIIEAHPELDFLVVTSYPIQQGIAKVHLWVRSLPKGIDPSFDTVVDRFINGDEEVRNRKLEMITQLGFDRNSMSLFSWICMAVLTFLLRFMTGGKPFVAQSSATQDRTPIPAVLFSDCFEMHHFGGALQSDPTLPSNYVAVNVSAEGSRFKSMIVARIILLTYQEQRGLPNDVVDITLVLAGEEEDELPERALATIRQVHVNIDEVTLPLRYSAPCHEAVSRQVEFDSIVKKSVVANQFTVMFRVFVTQPMAALIRGVTSSRIRQADDPSKRQLYSNTNNVRKNECRYLSSSDPWEKAVNELIEILGDVSIPVRKTQTAPFAPESTTAHPLLTIASAGDTLIMNQGDMTLVPILRMVNRGDIRRYFVASDCKLKKAAVRIVRSTTWRSHTFPIDTRTCHIELQNGQFFQQGKDLKGNPVYYFRNTLLGRWRKDEKSVIAAVLHRLETSLRAFALKDPDVRCTLIVMMGKPFRAKKSQDENGDAPRQATSSAASVGGDGSVQEEEAAEDDGAETVLDSDSLVGNDAPRRIDYNPRINSDEQWHTHTSKDLVHDLIDTVMTHYPERLSKALVVVGKGSTSYFRTAVGGNLALSRVISSARTREKVRFLTRYSDLRHYVAKQELPVLVGGTAPIDLSVYEC